MREQDAQERAEWRPVTQNDTPGVVGSVIIRVPLAADCQRTRSGPPGARWLPHAPDTPGEGGGQVSYGEDRYLVAGDRYPPARRGRACPGGVFGLSGRTCPGCYPSAGTEPLGDVSPGRRGRWGKCPWRPVLPRSELGKQSRHARCECVHASCSMSRGGPSERSRLRSCAMTDWLSQ